MRKAAILKETCSPKVPVAFPPGFLAYCDIIWASMMILLCRSVTMHLGTVREWLWALCLLLRYGQQQL
jgi:hypothetical protein